MKKLQIIMKTLEILSKERGLRIIQQEEDSIKILKLEDVSPIILKNLMALPINIHERYLDLLQQHLTYNIGSKTKFLVIEEVSIKKYGEQEIDEIIPSSIMYTDDNIDYTIYCNVNVKFSDPFGEDYVFNTCTIMSEIQILDKPILDNDDKFENQISTILTKLKSLSSEEFTKVFKVGGDVLEKEDLQSKGDYEGLTKEIFESDVLFCLLLDIKPSELTAMEMAMKIIELTFPSAKMGKLDRVIEKYEDIKNKNEFVDIVNSFLNNNDATLVIKTDPATVLQLVTKSIDINDINNIFSIPMKKCLRDVNDFLRNNLTDTGNKKGFLEFKVMCPNYPVGSVTKSFAILDNIELENKSNHYTVNIKLKKSN